ncbi:UNVERIFIED_CONTAM: hypothetical protein PYX00_000414 [Menopon gallinae]|uniref:Sodium-dependent nutrient amino acid transporter 1 n=1 Tax=Menopon gallinae TaxID=328185 RepID=A0AAW2I913_9NEOP
MMKSKDKYDLNHDVDAANAGSQQCQTPREESASAEGAPTAPDPEKKTGQVQRWNNGMEFLMSCIAMSVGLGNIWRFPFTAYENGRGAFLIAYLIVLTFVGRPMYYLEMAMGQFSGKGCVDVWECVPLLKGIGYSQLIATSTLLTYYCAVMAIIVFYLFASFSSTLPWSYCKPEWELCVDSSNYDVHVNRTGLLSSSELYYLKEVFHEVETIDHGIGIPDWKLAGCLLLSWITLFFLVIDGVKSTGRASYFLAIFPYVVLLCLMIRGCTLPGAVNGIIVFFKPVWSELLNPKVWYAAVTQACFSLSTSFGSLITYSSYNDFRHNIYRDALIVAALDTFTSVMAGITLFSILGNLAYEVNATNIEDVTKGGMGLAFISYPEATAKFDILPQFFAVMFFFMLFVLGAGSAVSSLNLVVKMVLDLFPNVKSWKVALVTSCIFFLIGLVYVTPGGQFIISLVDYYAGSFNILVIACVEIMAIGWIYGVKNVCKNIEFMLKRKVGIYWKVCWGFFAPVIMIVILLYTLATAEVLKYHDYEYPLSATSEFLNALLITLRS